MNKWFWILVLLFPLPLAAVPSYVSYQNWCMVGGQTVSVQGLTSTTNVQASFKSCTVTVHLHGGGLATLFSNSSGTPLSNPFTAQTNGLYQFYIDSTTATRYDITTSGGTPPFPVPVTLADVFIFSPGGGGGGGNVNNCGTVGSLAYYAVSGTSVSCIGAELTFATSTLTGGSGLTVDFSAINELVVPVAAFGVTAVPGDIIYDSTATNYHVFSASADHILVSAASVPNNGDCPIWVVGGGGSVLLGDTGSPCPSGTVTSVSGTANQVDVTAGNAPTVSLSSTIIFPGTITMGANAADFSSATSFKVPVGAGATSAANGEIAYDSTAKSTKIRTNNADSVAAAFASAPAGSKCLHTNGTTGLVTETASDCSSSSLAVAGVSGDVQMNNGAGNLVAAAINDNGTNILISKPTSYFIATAGAGGVTQNLLAAADNSNPTRFVLPVAGNCGVGFALTTATVGNTFLMGNAVQDEYTGIADNAVTAGHILIGGTVTPGRVKDSGGTQITGVSVGTCVVGKALNSGIAGDPIQVFYMGLGTFGTSGTATYTGSPAAGDIAVFTGTAGQISPSSTALTHTCEVVWGGTGTAGALQSGDDAAADQSCLNKLGVTQTITAVYCRSDNGTNTTTVNPTFGATGTGTTICSGALTCGSSGAYSASCTVSNGALTDGSNINPVMGGSLTGTSIHMVVISTASK